MRIIFVRHGEPNYEKDCLTETGLRQAEAAAERLAREGITEIYTSPFGRARQTAEATARRLGLPVTVLDFMHEITWGGEGVPEEGHPWTLGCKMMEENFDFHGQDWRKHPYFEKNTVLDEYARVSAEFDRFLEKQGYRHEEFRFFCGEKNEKTIALFSHGGSGAIVLSHLLTMPFPYVCAALPYDFTSVSILDFPSQPGEYVFPRLGLFNDCAHMRNARGPVFQQRPDGDRPSSVSAPLKLGEVRVRDAFWQREMELIRNSVIPYQWEALNDRVPGAVPSWWTHNMKAAARAVAARRAGQPWQTSGQTPAIQLLPGEGQSPAEDAFYGFAFQDSDGYKWLEAVAYQLALRPDEALQRQAQEAIDLIAAAQEEDGYLDTMYTITGRDRAFTNLRDLHELYCFGHLAEAAVAWHQATGRRDLLDIARRFAGCIARRFGPEGERGCPGHEIAEMALIRMYEETGEEEWLKLACFFLDVRGTEPSTFALEENRRRALEGLPPLPVTASRYAYHQAHLPVRDMKEAVGHAVRQMYLCCGMADEARLKQDQAMKEACERLWRSTVREKMYVTGGVGGTHVGEAFSRPFDLPSDAAYSETCAAIGLAFFARRMLQLQPKAEYADVLEQALYNTVLAGMALDGQSFFYVNPLEVDPEACETDERLSHVKPVRQKWFGCACCPPNIARIVSSLGQYIATRSDTAVYLHLYIGCELDVTLGGQELSLTWEPDIRQQGGALLTVTRGAAEGEIALRRPAWAEGLEIEAGGKDLREQDGYLILRGAWQAGDTVRLRFTVPVRVLQASPLVRKTLKEVCYAWGPWIFCAEEADNGKHLQLLRACPELGKYASLGETEIGGLRLPVLTVPGKRVRLPEEGPLYSLWASERTEDTEIRLIPYFAWTNRGKGEMRVWLPVI